MTWDRALEIEACGRVCLTLVHSLWQVGLAALLAAASSQLRLFASVERRYVVHTAALALGLAAAPITFVALNGTSSSDRLREGRTEVEGHATAAPSTSPVDARTRRAAPKPEAPTASPSEGEFAVAEQTPSPRLAAWFAALYAAGVAVMFARLAAGVVSAELMRRRACAIDDGPAADALRALTCTWRVRAAPRLAQADGIAAPLVVGFVKTTILLPASAAAGLSAGELEMILAHELAHVRRCDLWVNLLQRVAEAVLFFNPALWYLSRRITALREYCCDEMACGGKCTPSERNRVDYAAALVRVVELSHPRIAGRGELAALAIGSRSPSELRRRVARLLGEPVDDPLRVTRGGLALAAGTMAMVVLTSNWVRTDAQTPRANAAAVVGAFPGGPTEADRVVAAARKRTFGLQGVPRLALRQSHWCAPVVGMQGIQERTLEGLWRARDGEVDDAVRRQSEMTATLAWDVLRLATRCDSMLQSDASSPPELYSQVRYWDGLEGRQREISSRQKGVARYATIGELMEHAVEIYYPYWAAMGGRLAWDGPEVAMPHEIDASITRYERVGTETVDGVECDVFDGPARHERLWIDASRGVVKAQYRKYVHQSLPNYLSELVRDVAGRNFASQDEYASWRERQPEDMQASLAAHWAAAHWQIAEPGTLAVFSDYREVAPGVSLPMRCERVAVQYAGRDAADGYDYLRSEILVGSVTQDVALDDLIQDAMPHPGDKIWDRRERPWVDYVWEPLLTERDVDEIRRTRQSDIEERAFMERLINDAAIESPADAIAILTEGPKTDPTKVWARAIKHLVDHRAETLPLVMERLDAETRDHPISKLAFTLRAMGDRRAVPALIRALPRTLLPSRSDYGLLLDDPELLRFMQRHDQAGRVREGDACFEYGRAFREVVSALRRLTGEEFGEMELNWVHRAESQSQRAQQEAQFHRIARRWATWWEANWRQMVDDPAYASVDLPEPADPPSNAVGLRGLPAGLGVALESGRQNWIVESVHESNERCFVDLDTMREGGWPKSLPPVDEIGVEAPELLAWARQEGFDMMGVTHTPAGEKTPLYCLLPLDMQTWQLTPLEHRRLAAAMAGRELYPLSRPVELMVPQREVEPPYDDEHGGDAFLFVTREGTAGVLRMTAQVTDTGVVDGAAYSRSDQFSQVGYHRGAKISFAAMTEPIAD